MSEQITMSVEQLQAIIANAVADAAKVSTAKPANRKARRAAARGETSKGWTNTTANAAAPAAARPKAIYGTAATPKGTPKQVHDARVAQLEAAVPGISKVAYIFSAGKDVKDKLTKRYNEMVNTPFTWIELPGGKNFRCGKLEPDQVRAAIKACGYGFSKSNALWATDSKGKPVRRTFGKAQGAGKQLLNED